MVKLCRRRLIEIGIAVALTMMALLFAWTALAAETGEISIAEAWARPTIGQGKVTAAYMIISNAGQKDDVLVSARSPKSKKVEIHQTTMSDEGVMRMRELKDGLPLPAGGKVELKPGGYHIMIMGLYDPLEEGSDLPLTLEFAEAGPMELVVPVRAGGGSAHGHH